MYICYHLNDLKKYKLGKKLSGLDIYISIFCLLLLSLLEVFLLLLLIPLPVWVFFVNYGDLLMQIVIFVFSFFVLFLL